MLLAFDATAQNSGDTIKVQPAFLESNFYMKDRLLTLKQLEYKLSYNTTAYEVVRKGKTSKTFMQIFSFAGGFMVGYGLAEWLFTNKVNPYLIGSGISCIGISIPFALSYNKHLKKAVHIYNHPSP